MRILSFQKEFKDKLLSGTKVSTMRVHKRPHKEGDIVQVWCPSPRSGHGKKLFVAKIRAVQKVEISFKVYMTERCPELIHNNLRVDGESLEDMAYMEGFYDSWEMFGWFETRYGSEPKEFTRYVFRKQGRGNNV